MVACSFRAGFHLGVVSNVARFETRRVISSKHYTEHTASHELGHFAAVECSQGMPHSLRPV